jgi:DNA-binding NarL/FixJ family response regulator
MESRRLQVMVVDDNPVVAERIVGLLAEDLRIAVCDQVESGLLAFARVSAERPDAVLMDLEMPGIGGIAAIKRIKALFAPPAIIVVTLHEGPEMRAQAAAAGADAFVPKSRLANDLLNTLQSLFPGMAPRDEAAA